MASRPAFLPRPNVRRPSLRLRITLSFLATIAALTLTLSVATFFAVRTVLEDQRVRSSTRQSVFALLFAREFLTTRPDASQRLVFLLQTREHFDAMLTTEDDWFSTALSLTPARIPAGLKSLVREERVGYQHMRIGDERMLVFGAPLPQQGADLYLFYSLQDLDRTLSLLARVLAIAGLLIVLLSAGLAQELSKRILRPLAEVSAAAQRVAEGLLETRVEPYSSDEAGRLSASFNQMAAAFEQMLERERRFVASVSHELRTPLAALQPMGEVLSSHRDELSPAAREAVDLIVEDLADLRRLVEELMEVSELDSGRASVRWEQVDLLALGTSVLKKRRRAVEVEGEAIRTYADKARLERILGNLIDNAFQHGEGRDVRMSFAVDGGRCEIVVSDRGPGISPDDLPYVFERFYTGDRSRARERGGVGLGLAIAAQNSRLLGGTIHATSVAGLGSTFSLRLPLRDAPPDGMDG